MAMYLTADVQYETSTYRKVGDATVWDVIATDYVTCVPRTVGRVILRDGYYYVRDNTACGEPLQAPTGIARLGGALGLFARYLAS